MMKDKDRTPVAQNVITVCTKCAMELNHVVIAHKYEWHCGEGEVPHMWKRAQVPS